MDQKSSPSTPLVSVVIPCLNRAEYLIPTIKSILGQDYPNIECIVVDGGSTDGTVEILKGFGDAIRWISEPDHGHADAINKGWRMSKGEILAWLNADDTWELPSAVSVVVEFFDKNADVGVVYGDCGSIDANGNRVGLSYLHEWNLTYAVENCDHCIPQPAAFIRRSVLKQVNWLDTDFYQKKDHELWLRIALVSEIRYLPVLLAHARNTQGLSFDGRTAAPACIQVTRKFFKNPLVPQQLLQKKKIALSNSYLRGLQYAWYGGAHWSIMIRYAVRSIMLNPDSQHKVLEELRSFLQLERERGNRLKWAEVLVRIMNVVLLPTRIKLR